LREWRFLTNHGLVFLHKVLKPRGTVREIALDLGVTERAVHRILRDLEREGYLIKEKVGRRALYRTNADVAPLSHQLAKNVDVRDLFKELTRGAEPKAETRPPTAGNNWHTPVATASDSAGLAVALPVGASAGAEPVPTAAGNP